MNQAEHIKNTLFEDIHQISLHPEIFAKHPDRDFTRKRKLSAEDVLLFPIIMESQSLNRELLKYFHYSIDTPSVSAYCQQRQKLLPDTYRQIFQRFNSHFSDSLYKGKYVLTAVDGSSFNLFHNPHDKLTFLPPTKSSLQGHNELHVTAVYRLTERVFTDAVIQPSPQKNEYAAVCQLVDRGRTDHGFPLYIADRGFPSYNFFAHCKENGAFFLARAKDLYIERLLREDRPQNEEEFDLSIDRIIVRTKAKKNYSRPENPELYRFVDKNTLFDYIEPGAKGEYPLHLRVVRVKIKEGVYENLITNLPKEEFDLVELRILYYLRWGIETSFRELKHAVGASDFHCKSFEYVTHEIWARLLLYNFCSRVTACTVIKQKKRKYIYQVNYTLAIQNCHDFVRQRKEEPPIDILGLIKKYTLPIRPDRNFARQHRFQIPMKFTYRH